MKKNTRKAIRQRKVCMLLIIILIIVLSILGGGYYLLSQKNAALPQNGGQNSDSRNQTDLNQNSDTVEYRHINITIISAIIYSWELIQEKL